MWFAISLHWTAMLSIVIPDQVDHYFPETRGMWLAVVTSIGAVISAIVQISVGYRSDCTRSRWGRRKPYIATGTVLAVFGLWWMGVADDFTTFLASWVVIQLTLNIANGPYQALLPDLVPRSLHGTASTWMGLLQHLGQVAGPVLAGFILTRPQGLLKLNLIIAALLLVGMVVTVLGVQEPPGEVSTAGEGLLAAFKLPLGEYPNFRQLLLSRLVINLGFYTAIDFMYYYVRYSLAVPRAREETGILLAFMVVGGLVGGLPAGPLADRFSKVRLIYGTNALTGLAAIAFVLTHSIEQARWVGILLGLGFGAFTVVDWALACNLMPEGGTARFMGIWNLTAVLPQILAPALAGPATDWIAASTGDAWAYRMALAAVVVYLAVGTALLSRVREKNRGPAEETPV
ncbi:MAG: MFS transporter [Armatimonadetes bacterium]|nr:MFS transporter [Armatimonadota bacterium]